MHGVRKHRGVPAHQVAGPVDLRNPAVAAFRDQVREIFDRLRAAEQRFDGGVLLEVLHQVVGRAQRLVELAEQRAAADRERVAVGVDEHESGHAHRRVAEALDGAALARLAVEPLLDQAGIELHDLLDRHRHLVLPQLATQRFAVDDGLLEQAGAETDAFADDCHVRVDIVAAAGADADHVTVLDDQALGYGLRHQHRAGLLGLLREPGVELRPQHRVGVRMRAVADVLVVESDGRVRSHQPAPLVDDRPLERSLLPVLAYDLFEVVVVENAAHDIL